MNVPRIGSSPRTLTALPVTTDRQTHRPINRNKDITFYLLINANEWIITDRWY